MVQQTLLPFDELPVRNLQWQGADVQLSMHRDDEEIESHWRVRLNVGMPNPFRQ
jgi:hypothetical protein